jgi:hypothetical protein
VDSTEPLARLGPVIPLETPLVADGQHDLSRLSRASPSDGAATGPFGSAAYPHRLAHRGT